MIKKKLPGVPMEAQWLTLPTSTFKADTTNIDFPCLFYKVLEEEKRLRDMCQVSGQHDLNRSQMVRFLAVFGFPDERGR